ncbi:coiled-coil domain-containing protein 69 isoform X2 [Perognathus longimembris pacificus]|uniref:coiled-coil domain-containing protein 69 isoform X2 n=1 Tax=Perognathus longimembris pacificus TaxID=214514 RepID=UPI002018C901|nr:coiled-coil domain-containing protein 69 isoform X2 [Perognathus longimembris pacificus]
MGSGHSGLNCCHPQKKRHQEVSQPPHPEPQELGPLHKDAATTVQLCVSEQVQQHQEDITRILQQHEEEKAKWAQQVEKERELELQERLDEQRSTLEGKHEEALQVLRASYEKEKEAFTHSFREAKAALQDTIARLTSQLEAFQAKMKKVEESILSRDYKKHIQKEKNLMLEEKITTLQQENEDLHVRARNQAMVSRQLSEDLLLARQALEEEARIRQQLQQEKEELVYRVLGADASSTYPLASVTPTEISFLAT